jgi:hypothetical protein
MDVYIVWLQHTQHEDPQNVGVYLDAETAEREAGRLRAVLAVTPGYTVWSSQEYVEA